MKFTKRSILALSLVITGAIGAATFPASAIVLSEKNNEVQPYTTISRRVKEVRSYSDRNSVPEYIDITKLLPDGDIVVKCSGRLHLTSIEKNHDEWRATYEGVIYGYY